MRRSAGFEPPQSQASSHRRSGVRRSAGVEPQSVCSSAESAQGKVTVLRVVIPHLAPSPYLAFAYCSPLPPRRTSSLRLRLNLGSSLSLPFSRLMVSALDICCAPSLLDNPLCSINVPFVFFIPASLFILMNSIGLLYIGLAQRHRTRRRRSMRFQTKYQ